MLTENILYNIMVAWAEETLDTVDMFSDVLVIRAGQDMPRPNSAGGGSSLFVTVDLTGDQAIDQEPLYCENGVVDNAIERTRNVIREVTFSVSTYRTAAYDAARVLQTHLEGVREADIFFRPHGLAMNRYDAIARLRDIVHDQFEHRCQFSVYFRYVDTVVERDGIANSLCCGDEIITGTVTETTC